MEVELTAAAVALARLTIRWELPGTETSCAKRKVATERRVGLECAVVELRWILRSDTRSAKMGVGDRKLRRTTTKEASTRRGDKEW